MKKIGAFAIALTLFSATTASAETFLSPTIRGERVRACVNSYRYPDGCGDAARDLAANQFCKRQGYRYAKKWQWHTAPKRRPRRKKRVWEWTEQYKDGSMTRYWVRRGKKRRWFTAIECS